MKKIINLIPAGVFSVIATALVAYVLLSPSSGFSTGLMKFFHFKHSDKVFHFVLFFFLNLAYLYDYTKYVHPHHTRLNFDLMLTMFASTIGLLTETAQLVLGQGRTFEVADIFADVLGAFAAFGIMRWFGGHLLRKYVFRRKHRHHHRHLK